jgi:hypothetical protein
MRILPALWACMAFGFGASAVRAEMLTGPQIREVVSGNTVAGRYAGGSTFSEYHAVDGRALGDNGYTLNVDACWNIDGDAICYHYGKPGERRTYCFNIEKTAKDFQLRTVGSGLLNAVARIEKGNPRQHGDGGHRWSCDDLLSRRPPQDGHAAPRISMKTAR